MPRPSHPAALVAVLALSAVPASAHAATKEVSAGPPLAKPPAGVPQYADVPQFFPKTASVHVGDTVSWKFRGFHSVYFPKKGDGNVNLVTIDPARKYDEKDPTGAPFWFNGQPQFTANPAAAFPTGGKVEDGRTANGSGVPQSEKFSYKLKFTKAGTYTYFCTIHPLQKGTIKVLPRKAKLPSAAAERKVVAKQLATAIATLKRDDKRKAPEGAVVEAGRDRKGTTLLNFFPAKKTVPVGGSVEFRMAPQTNEIHTVSFGSPAVLGKGGYAEKQAQALLAPLPGTGQNGPPVLGIPGSVFFPSDQGPLAFDGTQHGGFLNAGLLGEKPLPRSAKVTFPKAGTFSYICIVHPDMKGEITVK